MRSWYPTIPLSLGGGIDAGIRAIIEAIEISRHHVIASSSTIMAEMRLPDGTRASGPVSTAAGCRGAGRRDGGGHKPVGWAVERV